MEGEAPSVISHDVRSGTRPDRNLALELVRVTEAAALAAARWVGRGEKEEADRPRSTRCACCSTRSRWTASS